MAFASIHVPNFMLQAVVRSDSTLRDQPVALVEGTPPLWCIVAADARAVEAGLRVGMPRAQAEHFVSVQIRQRSLAEEKAAHCELLDLGWRVSPNLEETAADTIALDLAGLKSIFGSHKKIAQQLFDYSQSAGLSTNIVIASNAEVAILASRSLAGITLIPTGQEMRYLRDLPVQALQPELQILETFSRWGIDTCGKLAALPILQLSERLGQEGVRLHELACGARSRSLTLAQLSIHFQEELELDDSVEDLESLSFLLGRLLDQLCARLLDRSIAAQSIRLNFCLEKPFQQNAETPKIVFYETILTLPTPTRDSKLLLKLIRLRLQAEPPPAAIRKILLEAQPVDIRFAQRGLFMPIAPEPEKLELTLARLSNLVGGGNAGSPELIDSHRPGAIRMTKFLLEQEVPGAGRTKRSAKQAEPQPTLSLPIIGFRVFRPEVTAKVELRNRSPQHVFFLGKSGSVKNASGPWRTSGDWWMEEAWNREEWDLEVEFTGKSQTHEPSPDRGLYRFSFDVMQKRWLVRGVYD